jgi:hypothetical protein
MLEILALNMQTFPPPFRFRLLSDAGAEEYSFTSGLVVIGSRRQMLGITGSLPGRRRVPLPERDFPVDQQYSQHIDLE